MVELKYLAKWANQSWTVGYGLQTSNYELRIADLPGNLLGTTAGNTITIDSNGAGMGWFIDATPWNDSEFDTKTQMGNQYDLLTVLTHELGHLHGHNHEHAGVMVATLDVNTRLIPEKTVDHTIPRHVDFAFAQWTPDLMSGRFAFSTIPLNQFQMESAETNRGQLALPSTEQRYFQTEMRQRIDRESAAVETSDPLDTKSERTDWTDLDLTDKLFGEFDKLINEFEIVLG